MIGGKAEFLSVDTSKHAPIKVQTNQQNLVAQISNAETRFHTSMACGHARVRNQAPVDRRLVMAVKYYIVPPPQPAAQQALAAPTAGRAAASNPKRHVRHAFGLCHGRALDGVPRPVEHARRHRPVGPQRADLSAGAVARALPPVCAERCAASCQPIQRWHVFSGVVA